MSSGSACAARVPLLPPDAGAASKPMGGSDRAEHAREAVRGLGELRDTRRFPRGERVPPVHALAMQVAQVPPVERRAGKRAELREEPRAMGREIVIVDDRNAWAEPRGDLER